MSGYMPVIKLPTSKHKPSVVRQSRVFSTANKSDISKEELFDHSNDCLVSETLFLSKLPANIKEADIRTLLQHCMPVEIYIDKERDIGYLRFSHVKYADKAYSLYNGFTFTNSAKLELQMYEDKSLDPEATAMLLEVDGLPEYYDDNILYDLFRPFGPLNLCKCILKDGVFKGSAFIQFFDPSNSDKAEASLNGRIIDEQQLSVVPFMPPKAHASQSKQQPQKEEGYISQNSTNSNSLRKELEAQQNSNNNSGSVDMLNLYIKNLEPHITNHDLSQAFRKFGRIISARVMTNPATGQSKGYGFVSFGRSEEAAAALREMDGVMLGNRSIIVAYHEPRKGRANVTGTCNTTPTAPSTNSNNFKNNSHRNSTFNNKLRYQQQQQDHHNINQNQFQQQENFYANKHHQQQPMQTNHDSVPSLSAAPFHAHGMNNVVETIPPNINSNLKELSIGQRPTNLHNASATSSTTISLPQKKMLDAACTNSSPSQSMQQQHSYHTHNSNKVSGPRYSSSPISGGASTTGHSLASLASGLSIQRPPPSLVNQQHPMATAYSSSSSSLASPVNHNSNNSSCNFLHQSNGSSRHQRPTLRRRGSIESVMTESSANIQRLKLEEAVRQCCVRNNYSNNQITEIVDMLLTLKRKDRSICLFNPDFLQKKVQLAIEALATCHDSDDEESKNDEIEDRSRRFTVTKKSGSPLPNTQGSFTPSPIATPAQQPIYYPVINPMMGVHPYHHNNNVAIKPPIVRESKAIPIVAPPSLSSSDNTSTAQKSSSLTKENLVKNEKIAAENPPTSSSAGTSTLTTAATEVDKKITITTPTNTNTNTSANTSNYNNNITTADQNTVASSNDEIETLLNNIENKPVHEKKQLLGDKLFPLVKATGTKQAPKVTIYLLDTIDLQKLAHIMYDTPQLKECVENAFQALQK